jgi:Tol biopolymer transport system component
VRADDGLARRTWRFWSWLLLATLAAGLGSEGVEGQSPTVTQITNTTVTQNFDVSINADGTRIAFHSAADLAPWMPGNADGNQEIFLFDTTTGLFAQITNTTVSLNVDPSINANGTRIAFTSSADLTPGNPGNADHNNEVFLYDTTSGVFTQITNTTGGFLTTFNGVPSINAAGNRVAFASTHDLTPGSPGNADRSREIFLFDTTSGVLTQITHGVGTEDSMNPSINAGGTRIAFESTSDLAPGSPGNADGNREIFVFDTTSGLFTQITNTTGTGFTGSPSINAAGTRIAFHSNRDVTPGNPGNADGNVEIFLFDTTSGVTTQITNATVSPSLGPSINAAGTRIAFVSGSDLAPGPAGNADRNSEIFVFDTTTGVTTQVTNTVGNFPFVPSVSINADGTRIAFDFQNDPTPGMPGNPDGNLEIFLAVLPFSPGAVAVPTLSESMQWAAAAFLLISGLLALRRLAPSGRKPRP